MIYPPPPSPPKLARVVFLFREVRPPNNNVVGSAPRSGRWRVTQSQKRAPCDPAVLA